MKKEIIGLMAVVVLIVGGALIYSVNRSSKKSPAMPESNNQAPRFPQQPVLESNNAVSSQNPSEKITVSLNALNNSGESGTATLEDINGKAKVEIKLTGAPRGVAQPAHIHVGSCPGVGAIKYPLASVTNGESVTNLDVPVSQIMKELPLAINVHKSAAESSIYYSCGEIPSSGMNISSPSSDNSKANSASDDRKSGGAFSTPTDRRRGADKPED